MVYNFSASKIAGILIIIGSIGHFLPALIGSLKVWRNILKDRWWNTIPPPWTNREIEIQKAFWVVWGSFALPFLILGILILWLAKHKIKIPKLISYGILIYALITATLIPTGGMWIFIISACLLLIEKQS